MAEGREALDLFLFFTESRFGKRLPGLCHTRVSILPK